MSTLANLTTYFAGNSTSFLSAIDKSRGGLRALLKELDPVAAATDKFNRQSTMLDNALKRGTLTTLDHGRAMGTLRERYQQTIQQQGRLATSSGQMRAGMQQLSFQIGDVATQFASGTRPMIIFAQQGGQVIQALQMMTNKTTGLLGFLGGPWGQILTAALVVLTPFVAKLFEGGDAARDAAAGADAYTAALKRLQDQAGSFSFSSDEFGLVHKAYLESEGTVGRLDIERKTAPVNPPSYASPTNWRAPNTGTQPIRSRAQVEAEYRAAVIDRDNKQTAMNALMMQRRNRQRLDVGRSAGGGAGSGSSGGRGSTETGAGAPDRRGIDDAHYADLMGRQRLGALRAQASLTEAIETRYALALAEIEEDRASFRRQIDLDKALTDRQRIKLVYAKEKETDLREQAAEQDRQDALARRDFEIDRETFAAAEEAAQSQLAMTRTMAERREVEMRLLALQKEQERKQLQNVIDTSPVGSSAMANAQNALASLDQRYGTKADAINRNTQGPLGQYLSSMPQTIDEINEAFEGVAVDGLQQVNDQLAETTVRLLGIKGIAGRVLEDFLKIVYQQKLLKPFAEGLSSGGGFDLSFLGLGGGGGFNTGSIKAGLGSLKLPGFANEGSFMVGGAGGVDSQLLSIGGMPRAWVSPTERIDVRNPANDRGGGTTVVNVYAKDAVLTSTVRQWVAEGIDEAHSRAVGTVAKGIRRKRTQGLVRG